MALNKFCPVAQGEYYNNKSLSKSQPFFTIFLFSSRSSIDALAGIAIIESIPAAYAPSGCAVTNHFHKPVAQDSTVFSKYDCFKSNVREAWRVILVSEAFLSIGDLTPSETNLLLHKKNRTLGLAPLSCFLLFVCFYHCL